MIFNFIAIMGLMNMIGGRWPDVIGKDAAIGGRLIFRCVLPGLFAGAAFYEATSSVWMTIYVWMAVTLGSALWFPWGWSFDEISGKYDSIKYPRWVQRIGLNLVPLGIGNSRNRLRGILMKGIRGSFDILTFAMLVAVNPWAWIFWPFTFLQGAVYWACGRIFGEEYGVLSGEAAWGAVRGLLIFMAMGIS